jgi:hypothetical protein
MAMIDVGFVRKLHRYEAFQNALHHCRADAPQSVPGTCRTGKKKGPRAERSRAFAGLAGRSWSRQAIMTMQHQNALAMPNTMALLQSEEPPQSVSLSEVSLYISDRFTPEKGMVSDTL